jgi:F0F1-type ATP synthase assembly protein I
MKKSDRNTFKALAMITQFGINILVPVFLCVFAGIWLDRFFGTSFIVVILFFLGAAAGFRNIYIMSKDIYGDKEGRGRKH